MNDRDTHFQESAKLLYDKIGTLNTQDIQRFGDYTSFDVAAKKLIAQYAYDLAMHIKRSLDQWEFEQMLDHRYDWNALFEDIPDLTEWPTTEPSGPPTSEPR